MKTDKLDILILAAVVLLLLFSNGSIIGPAPPIPDTGLRVLVTYSESNRFELPAGQKQIITSPTLRNWLDAHCVKDAKDTPEWRVWSDATKPGADQPIWQKLMAVPRQKPEWLVVSDGKRGVSRELPADEPALMAILAPFGGGK